MNDLEELEAPRGIPGGRRRTDHEGFVTITNREVYDRLGLVDSRLAQLGVKLDPMAVALGELRAESADHEGRLRSLERRAWALVGGAAVMGGATGALAGAVGL